MPEEKKTEEVPFRCDGSYKLGTACGKCVRCEERGYTVEDMKKAKEAEDERTKDLPADRVKPRNAPPIIVVEQVIAQPEDKKEEQEQVDPAEPVTPESKKEKL